MEDRTFTVKEIAELVGVSKPTAQKIFAEMGIEPIETENNNRRIYSYEDGKRVLERLQPDFDFSKITEKTAKPQNITANLAENTAKLQLAQMEALNKTIEVLTDQLEKKDQQLAAKDQQIKDLNDRLAEALALSKQQHYISAAEKTKDLIEVQTDTKNSQDKPAVDPETIKPEPPQKPQKKRSFWSRLFQ